MINEQPEPACNAAWPSAVDREQVLISVIVPAYNYAHLLPRALDSVFVQWAADIELLVVNDGSQDNTAEVLTEYQARHPQLQVIQQSNAGAAAARNHGIRLARGRYALLLDADDELVADAFASLRSVLQANPQAGLVLGAQLSVTADGRERLRLPTPAKWHASAADSNVICWKRKSPSRTAARCFAAICCCSDRIRKACAAVKIFRYLPTC